MTMQRKYGEPVEFVTREGQLVRITKEGLKPVGRAYGFFDCDASKAAIEAELPHLRHMAQTPNQLELSLTEGVGTLQVDSALRAIIQQSEYPPYRFALQARYEGATNRETADQLNSILNQAYQSPLYQKGEPFRGDIVYEENGDYLLYE